MVSCRLEFLEPQIVFPYGSRRFLRMTTSLNELQQMYGKVHLFIPILMMMVKITILLVMKNGMLISRNLSQFMWHITCPWLLLRIQQMCICRRMPLRRGRSRLIRIRIPWNSGSHIARTSALPVGPHLMQVTTLHGVALSIMYLMQKFSKTLAKIVACLQFCTPSGKIVRVLRLRQSLWRIARNMRHLRCTRISVMPSCITTWLAGRQSRLLAMRSTSMWITLVLKRMPGMK